MISLVTLLSLCAIVNAQVGQSGIVDPNGNNIQFSHDFANGDILIGPSGVVSRHGNIQLTAGQAKLAAASRSKRSLSAIPAGSLIGASGYITPDGRPFQFTSDIADNILLKGPSGIITKDGNNIQFRAKRSAPPLPLIGASGLLTAGGQNIQFKTPGVTVLLDGPGGMVLSDGTLIQKRSKRHVVGESGIITSDGQSFQFKHGTQGPVTVVLDGPSGMLLSNGMLIQKKP